MEIHDEQFKKNILKLPEDKNYFVLTGKNNLDPYIILNKIYTRYIGNSYLIDAAIVKDKKTRDYSLDLARDLDLGRHLIFLELYAVLSKTEIKIICIDRPELLFTYSSSKEIFSKLIKEDKKLFIATKSRSFLDDDPLNNYYCMRDKNNKIFIS